MIGHSLIVGVRTFALRLPWSSTRVWSTSSTTETTTSKVSIITISRTPTKQKNDVHIKIDPMANFMEEVDAVLKDDKVLTSTYRHLSAHAAQARAAGKVTFLLQHIPAFAVVCDADKWVGYNPNVQKCFHEGWAEPDKLCAILCGHMHWYQRWTPKSAGTGHIPTQFVIGNGGTLLIPKEGVPPIGDQRISFLLRRAKGEDGEGREVEVEGLISHGYGHSIFTQGEDGAFSCVHYMLDASISDFKEVDSFRIGG